MEKKIKRIAFGILTPFAVFFSFLLINQFFLQDEWHSFGLIQVYGSDYLLLGKPLLESILSDRFGARVLMFSFYKSFEINPLPYGIFAVFIHFLNTFFVYYLSNLLTKKKAIAIITASFFLVNSVGYQAYAWFGTLMGSAVSVCFILISFIYYVIFLQQKKYFFLFLSIIAIFSSFLFKELAISLLVLYPILWIINPYRKKTIRSFIVENGIFLLYGAFMAILLAYVIISIPGERANYIEAKSPGYIKLLQHLIMYSFQGIVQPIIPSQVVFETARMITIFFVPSFTPETSEFDAFYQTQMAEGVIYFLAFIFLCILIYFYIRILRKKSTDLQFAFFGSFLFLLFSYIPYIVLDKFDAYLDSRYYYSATIGASLLFGILAYYILITKNRAKKIIVAGLSLLFVSHMVFLFLDLFNQYKIGQERQSIIQRITNYAPQLNKNTVFYITGNSSGYYGIPELKVPFQSGLGQVLTTVYVSKRQLNPEIFRDETFVKTLDQGFLYDTIAQGYKQINSQGFGYYYDKNELKKALGRKEFSDKDIIFLYYDTDTKSIERKRFTL